MTAAEEAGAVLRILEGLQQGRHLVAEAEATSRDRDYMLARFDSLIATCRGALARLGHADVPVMAAAPGAIQ